MAEIAHPQFVSLVRETRQCLNFSQTKFVAKLGVSFQSIHCWEHGRPKPLPIALKQIKSLLDQVGKAGQNLLVKYFLE
uniref:Transcriptional regulator n=1 Tax=Oscillatoriales cyanobacterium SpSt-418 TaxID=2282169 RepID=A0A7C3KCW6_9CYAN